MSQLENKIKVYQLSQKGLKKMLRFNLDNDFSWLPKTLFLSTLPSLGAVTSLNAQCQPGATTATYALPYNSSVGFRIDVDGDGTDDFEIQDSPIPLLASLNVDILNGGAVLTSGGSGTVKNYAMGAVINGAAGTNTFSSLAWLVFNPGLGGPWGSPFPTSGYIGIKQGGMNGFIQLTVHQSNSGGGNSYEISVLSAGLANAPGSIVAGDCSSLLLPVEFTRFEGITEGNKIVLNWETASENNNVGFEIERSTDGQNFNRLDFIEGNGTTTTLQQYQYIDATAVKGKKYYYRLKQIDFDGQFDFSEIIVVSLDSEVVVSEVFPNPTSSGKVSLDINTTKNGKWSINVFDVTGLQILSSTRNIKEGQSVQQFDFSRFSAGVYFLKMEEGSNRIYRKIVISK